MHLNPDTPKHPARRQPRRPRVRGIVSIEYLIIGSILGIGAIVAFGIIRNAVIEEAVDFANAIDGFAGNFFATGSGSNTDDQEDIVLEWFQPIEEDGSPVDVDAEISSPSETTEDSDGSP